MAKKRGNKDEEQTEQQSTESREMTQEEKDAEAALKAQAEENKELESKLRKALEGEDRTNSARIRIIVQNIAGKTARLAIDRNGTINVENESGLSIKI